jgi:hypothetical protein
MRPLMLLISICSGSSCWAGEREAVVVVDEAVLLAGPGGGMPETMRLRRGQRVRVAMEEGAYYVIQPPAGSIAWVRGAYLQFVPERAGGPVNFPAAAVVDGNQQVKIRPGRVNEPKPLAVERTTVPDGTAVTVVGQKIDVEGVKWYPIAAPDDDFRYVLKESIRIGEPIDSKFVVNGTQATFPRTASAAVVANQATGESRFRDAQAAEQAGDLERAERLYLECAKEMAKPGGSDKLAEQCYAKVHEIRERKRKAGQLAAPSRTLAATVPDRPPSAPTSANDRRSDAATEGGWQGPGTVYPSSIRFNGQKLYALQSNSQTVLTYLLPGPGIDLSSYSGKSIRVYGQSAPLTGYAGKTVMTVAKVGD